MANTFLLAQGIAIGKSLAERDMADTAREILAKAQGARLEIVLPVDAVVAEALKPGIATSTVADRQGAGRPLILDVGPATVADLETRLAGCRRWSGTDRWAPSRRRPSMPARSPWPGPRRS